MSPANDATGWEWLIATLIAIALMMLFPTS